MEGMDLRKQLHDVLWARVLFTLALLLAVLWVQIDDHGLVAVELLVSLAVVVAANVPFFLLEHRVQTRTLTAAIAVVDLALVTVAIVFSGGALSALAVFYVWPIVLAAVFLPVWAPYAAAAAAGAAYAGIWELQHVSWLRASAMVAEIEARPNWMLITVCLHVAAFLLVALLAGRLATALVRTTVQLGAAKADTDEQLRLMQATNEQLHVMSETSRVFLRQQDVDALMPEALTQIMGASGINTGFALVLNHNSGDLDVKAELGRLDAAFVRKMKELGIADVAKAGAQLHEAVTDPQVGRLLKAAEKSGFRGFLAAPLEAKHELLGVICLLYRQNEVVPPAAVATVRALSDQVALVVRNIQYLSLIHI